MKVSYTLSNPAINARWGPINNAKIQELARIEAEARIEKFLINEEFLREDDVKVIAKEITRYFN